ncbi:uncharacterized protein BXZ73DRAFT_108095 [Epithele typhae]|uniref:uncharacterized protein n=1 Tax=Epithele typhae TaxID=378194 RepID=UPI00200844D3|nr:uncharacterized protein BXZ73DRAFT_108095 [Epithele typhae]KAH9911330.1 hypothetical protein BXZ73DRAFT_108095 [Epithele typhae]
MLRFYRTLFTGAGSETPCEATRRGQKSLAAKDHTVKATLHSIIYAACLLRFTLSSRSAWDEKDCGWVNSAFSYAIVGIASRAPHWKSSLLEYYDCEVFSPISDASEYVLGTDPDSAYARIMASLDERY